MSYRCCSAVKTITIVPRWVTNSPLTTLLDVRSPQYARRRDILIVPGTDTHRFVSCISIYHWPKIGASVYFLLTNGSSVLCSGCCSCRWRHLPAFLLSSARLRDVLSPPTLVGGAGSMRPCLLERCWEKWVTKRARVLFWAATSPQNGPESWLILQSTA